MSTGFTSVSLLTVDEVKKLNSEQLNEYLRRRLKDTTNINKHANTITVEQEVDGSNFLDLTRDDLLSIKIPLGPVKDIEKMINEIKGDISDLKSSIEHIKDKLENIYELTARHEISKTQGSHYTSKFDVFDAYGLIRLALPRRQLLSEHVL
ncbi:unnamed protein product [Rhizophagus irregularis]|uniref:SAM domain-containing protein n=1 Tax=Rhizophagus irregularis TaxID=588596 RepID=A0A2I1GDJ8_9GLOM|nr:hypothetical protein RhiirA4_419259 [Rhizophagus irregularis]CAB4429448.1 unnamed protein product [Rhizophagus irregularis]